MKHTIELQPFTVPNFVRPVVKPGRRQDGFVETPAIPLSDLNLDTLDALCRAFREAVFIKAGKVPNVQIEARPAFGASLSNAGLGTGKDEA